MPIHSNNKTNRIFPFKDIFETIFDDCSVLLDVGKRLIKNILIHLRAV